MTTPPARKIYVPPRVNKLAPEDNIRVNRTDNPFYFRTTPTQVGQAGGVTDETAARIAADEAERDARILADSTERAARIAADNAEATARATAVNAEAVARHNEVLNEGAIRAAGDTASHFAALDLSGLPTTDPGGGRVWLKAGDLHVGP